MWGVNITVHFLFYQIRVVMSAKEIVFLLTHVSFFFFFFFLNRILGKITYLITFSQEVGKGQKRNWFDPGIFLPLQDRTNFKADKYMILILKDANPICDVKTSAWFHLVANPGVHQMCYTSGDTWGDNMCSFSYQMT